MLRSSLPRVLGLLLLAALLLVGAVVVYDDCDIKNRLQEYRPSLWTGAIVGLLGASGTAVAAAVSYPFLQSRWLTVATVAAVVIAGAYVGVSAAIISESTGCGD
jgi:energy-converting hydrogenase Eha subunit E